MTAATQDLLTPFRMDRKRYYDLLVAGVFGPDDRIELLNGQLVKKMVIGNRHNQCVNRLNMHFAALGAQRLVVQVQGPVQADEYNEPEPDVALLRPDDERDLSDHARPEDVLLLVEVAESSLLRDRNIKIPLYARAGIAEAWLVDLISNAVFVHRDPADGVYGSIQRYTGSDTLAPLAFPEHRVSVDALLR